MSVLADLLSTLFERRQGWALTAGRDPRSLPDLAQALVSAPGEVSGLTLAGQILARFAALDDEGKLEFFHHLAERMDIDPESVRVALADYEEGPSKQTYRTFLDAVEPRRQELIRRLNQVPGGTGRLVGMRADLLRLGRKVPELEALDLDFRHLFASWFNRGFLVLRPISWESPAHILEKIIAYEAVHAIHSWEDLRGRVEPADRRCFAFFHPAMPDEPLIFVEVALTSGVPGSVQGLLAADRKVLAPEDVDTAVFYSISNCQSGLAGISFGNSLIKQVVADLATELPGLKTFVTLSPIPGLDAWRQAEGLGDWPADPEALRRMAAEYLLTAKGADGLPRDPVARFHLGNGALVHAVHAQADTSDKGRGQSGGAMVNYLYDMKKIYQNQDQFASAQRIVATGEVRSLANQGAKTRSTER